MSSRSPSEVLAQADATDEVREVVEHAVALLPAPLLEPRRGYRFAPENLLLPGWLSSHMPLPAGPVLDLGSGSGILGLLVACMPGPPRALVAVEAQPALASLTERNAKRMGIQAKVWCGDLRALHREPAPIVVANPPFYDANEGQPSRHAQVHAATHALRGGVEDFAHAMAQHLAPDGIGLLVYPADRLARALGAITHAGLHARRILVVWARHTGRPHRVWLALAHTPGPLSVHNLTAYTSR